MLKLTQIKGEKKKKDTVFLNVTHHILKTDCTEHYHAHNKPAGKTSTFVMVFLVFSFSFTWTVNGFAFPQGYLCSVSIKPHDGEQIIHFKFFLNDTFADQESKWCGITIWISMLLFVLRQVKDSVTAFWANWLMFSPLMTNEDKVYPQLVSKI